MHIITEHIKITK